MVRRFGYQRVRPGESTNGCTTFSLNHWFEPSQGDRQHRSLSIVRQCQLLGVSRSSLYYRTKAASQQDLSLMRETDRQYLETPFFGSRRMRTSLERQGMPVSRKRVQRLMRLMGLRAIYRQPRTSQRRNAGSIATR